MTAPDHGARAVSFGIDADAYDRSRPGYPAEVLDDLAVGAVDVVDVGCGTGKLARALAARGCRVLGVEPDERMAAVARRHGIEVEVAPFETWDARGRRFDLVASAQAWHWIDPVVGARRAAELLRLGGRLAVVWNLTRHQPDVKVLLDEAYQRIAPELVTSVAVGIEVRDEPLAGLDETGAFGPQARQLVTWEQRYTAGEWLDQLPTHSDHRLLDVERRVALLAAVRGAIESVGGSLTVTYTTLCITATRR